MNTYTVERHELGQPLIHEECKVCQSEPSTYCVIARREAGGSASTYSCNGCVREADLRALFLLLDYSPTGEPLDVWGALGGIFPPAVLSPDLAEATAPTVTYQTLSLERVLDHVRQDAETIGELARAVNVLRDLVAEHDRAIVDTRDRVTSLGRAIEARQGRAA